MKLHLSAALAATISFTGLVGNAHGHGYLFEPLSRNYYAYTNGLDWGPPQAGVPAKEYCSHCVNTKGPGSVCGTSEQGVNYDVWEDSIQQPMPWNSNGNVYVEGDVITIKSFLTSHHTGHMEVRACPLGRESTQECFDENILTFVEDEIYDMPKDENYPERGYYYGSCDFNNNEFAMKFKLPDGLVGDQVLLQWWYYTANSCTPSGYREYYEANSGLSQDFYNPDVADCTPDQWTEEFYAGDWPERFVNCAEVSIVSGNGSVPTPAPVASTQPPVQVDGTPSIAPPSPTPVPTNAPVVSPVEVSPVEPPPNSGDGPKMMAYLGNWKDCPTSEQIAEYTHIVIAFAVSYTWAPGKNQCSETCEIAAPPTCNNAYRPDLIADWQAQGKKVILSFGGAGMGGSWSSSNDDCWEYCFGREGQVIDRLGEIVEEQNLDGVDIDYEYYYENNQNGSGFMKGTEAQTFLKEVTLGLRSTLPAEKELIHVPMEPDVVPGTGYYSVLEEVASALDYIMPQYYNGYERPFTNMDGALQHYANVIQLFDNDASRVVFGFCINDCGSFDLNGDQAAWVMEKLSDSYPCNGGAFFWMALYDTAGAWSSRVNEVIDADAALCAIDNPVADPTLAPVANPTSAPVAIETLAPVANPTSAPVAIQTLAPVTTPTSAPVAIQTLAPVSNDDDNNGCCSNDYKTCASWCQDQSQCGISAACADMKWLDNGALPSSESRGARWEACTYSGDAGCVDGLVCKGDSQWYKQCLAPNDPVPTRKLRSKA